MNWKTLLRGTLLTGALAALCIATASAQVVGVGTVKGDGLRLRADASIESSVLATANQGAAVVVLEDAQDNWYKVSLNGQEGYMSAGFVEVSAEAEAKLGSGKVTTSGDPLNMRAGAGSENGIICAIPNGTVVELTGVKNGWYQISYGGKTGFVSSDYVVPTTEAASAAAPSAVAAKIVANAKAQLGKPYRWGAAGPSAFDCSGFTQYVAKISGFSIPRGATSQWRGCSGTYIKNYSNLQAGDFIYICNPAYANGYPVSHALIYLGNNQVIHADSTRRQISIKSFENYKKYFVGAWRLG